MDEMLNTVIVGGGQAGLAVGYFLARRNERFAILDQNMRTGDTWRSRWDSLHLFTPAKYNGLPGMPFPGAAFYFPTKDEAADYLEDYARQFNLPVRYNTKVRSLSCGENGFNVSTNAGSVVANNVIIATGAYQKAFTPPFYRELAASILQMHSSAYCNPQQIAAQNILVVGAGNSGAEISLELAKNGKRVWLAGPSVGRIPADKLGRIFGGRLYWWLISQVLSVRTPIGRKMSGNIIHHGAPLIRVNPDEIARAGIKRVPRVTGVNSGKPQLEDGSSLPVEAVIWSTGFRPDFSWVQLPVFDARGFPRHQRGVVHEAPGLYFVGMPFQTALSSALLGGVGADAEYIARQMHPNDARA